MSAPIFVVRLMPNLEVSYQGPSSVDRVEWAIFQDGEQKGPIGEGTLSVLGKAFRSINNSSTRIILITPAEHVVLTRVKIPLNQKRHRSRLVSYMLEDALNQNVDEVFFAQQWLDQTQDVGVAYTSRALFERWLTLMQNQGLAVDFVYPEHYLLPQQPEHIFVVMSREKVLIRHDNWSASCATLNMTPVWLKRVVLEAVDRVVAANAQDDLGQKEHTPVDGDDKSSSDASETENTPPTLLSDENIKVRLIFDGNDPDLVQMSKTCEAMVRGLKTPVNLSAKRLLLKQNTTQIFASEAAKLVMEHHSFQLLQGDFKSFRRKRESRYPYKAAVGLALAALGFHLGLVSLDYTIHKNALTELRQENLETFKSAFPSVQRVRGSLKRALDTQLAQSGNTNNDAEFLVLLNDIGPSLNQAEGLEIRRLAYDGDQSTLRVDLKVKNYPDLENIKQGIEAQSLAVKIDGANKEKVGVKARLRISRDA